MYYFFSGGLFFTFFSLFDFLIFILLLDPNININIEIFLLDIHFLLSRFLILSSLIFLFILVYCFSYTL